LALEKPEDSPRALHGREFRAFLRKVSSGRYRAEYRCAFNPHNPDEWELRGFHLSSSMANAKQWVEQMALDMGYESVAWDSLPGE
jgi:hypothetical protein